MSRPVLYLWRQRVAGGWDRSSDGSMVALASITIPWGRASIFDPVTPKVATIKLLDTSGDAERFLNNTVLGARVDVMREQPNGTQTTIFTGQVSDQTAREITMDDPRTDMPKRVLEITLTAMDVAGVLSAMRPRGSYPGLQNYGQGGTPTDLVPGPWGYNGWDAKFAPARLSEVLSKVSGWLTQAAAPRETLPRPDHPMAIDTAPGRTIHHGIPASDLESMWTLLHRIYAAAQGLGWPSYRPGAGVEQGMPQTASAITLAKSAGKLVISTAMASLPASQLRIASRHELPAATSSALVASIAVELSRHRYRWQSRLTDQYGAVIREAQLLDDDDSNTVIVLVDNARGAQRELKLDVATSGDVVLPLNDSSPATNNSAHQGWNYGIALAIEAAGRAAQLNDWMEHPPVVYRPAKDGAEVDALLNTWDSGPVLLAGSKWIAVRRVPRVVQIIGGTLTFDGDGWAHSLTLAPTLDQEPRDIPLSTLLGNVNSRIDTFADDVTLNLLAAASRSTAT